MIRLLLVLAAGMSFALSSLTARGEGPFLVEKTFEVGGEGGWDLLAVDSAAHRLYVPRSNRVMVIDTETGKSVGEIKETDGVHGVAVAPDFKKGYTSNGKAGTVTVFDLESLKTLKTLKAGGNPDVIMFDAASKTVLCFNGRSKDVTVINAENDEVKGTIAIGGKPELAVSDGSGNVYVNVEDTSEVVHIDLKAMNVDKRFALAPGEEPTGLAIDGSHEHLFAACGNQKLAVLDIESGKVVATPAIGKSVDGAEFDVADGYALTSNGEGTLSVIGAKGDSFEVVQTLKTAASARTLVMDQKSGKIYLAAAEFEPAETPKDASAPKPRPKMKAGSFKILVVAHSAK